MRARSLNNSSSSLSSKKTQPQQQQQRVVVVYLPRRSTTPNETQIDLSLRKINSPACTHVLPPVAHMYIYTQTGTDTRGYYMHIAQGRGEQHELASERVYTYTLFFANSRERSRLLTVFLLARTHAHTILALSQEVVFLREFRARGAPLSARVERNASERE